MSGVSGRPFEGAWALVTGASSGIGRALGRALGAGGARVILSGRDRGRLEAVAGELAAAGGEAEVAPADLRDDAGLAARAASVGARAPRLDLLVHCAGVVTLGAVGETRAEDLDLNWAVNLRAPFLLTQALLPRVRAARGQVVFVNSGAGLSANPGWGAYAASKHGLKALADALRAEVRGDGVRVLSVYPGRTASPMQVVVKRHEGAPYEPERLIQPEDVSRIVVQALALPRTAHVVDVNIRGA